MGGLCSRPSSHVCLGREVACKRGSPCDQDRQGESRGRSGCPREGTAGAEGVVGRARGSCRCGGLRWAESGPKAGWHVSSQHRRPSSPGLGTQPQPIVPPLALWVGLGEGVTAQNEAWLLNSIPGSKRAPHLLQLGWLCPLAESSPPGTGSCESTVRDSVRWTRQVKGAI